MSLMLCAPVRVTVVCRYSHRIRSGKAIRRGGVGPHVPKQESRLELADGLAGTPARARIQRTRVSASAPEDGEMIQFH